MEENKVKQKQSADIEKLDLSILLPDNFLLNTGNLSSDGFDDFDNSVLLTGGGSGSSLASLKDTGDSNPDLTISLNFIAQEADQSKLLIDGTLLIAG
jgi:hypothetical protein